jgi:hypothetical protein
MISSLLSPLEITLNTTQQGIFGLWNLHPEESSSYSLGTRAQSQRIQALFRKRLGVVFSEVPSDDADVSHVDFFIFIARYLGSTVTLLLDSEGIIFSIPSSI